MEKPMDLRACEVLAIGRDDRWTGMIEDTGCTAEEMIAVVFLTWEIFTHEQRQTLAVTLIQLCSIFR